MLRLGLPEFLILFLIVVLLFGAGRIGKIAKELGTGIRSFREAIRSDESTPDEDR